MIETGNTLLNFHRACKKAGAKNLVALATHRVLLEGLSRVRKTFKKVFVTNSIETAKGNVDIVSLVLKAIK